MLPSQCFLHPNLLFDVIAHLVFLISIPTCSAAFWVLGFRCPGNFQKYRFLLMAHVFTCLLLEIHMSVIWKFVGVVPWAALCAQGLASEFSVQCFQSTIFLLLLTIISVSSLFKYRMKAVISKKFRILQKVMIVLEILFWGFAVLVITFTILSFHDFKYQLEYKKQVEKKFSSMPEFIWCDNCFFIRFDSPIIRTFFIFSYCIVSTSITQWSCALYVSVQSLKKMKILFSAKTVEMQKNFLMSLFVMISIHAVFFIVPLTEKSDDEMRRVMMKWFSREEASPQVATDLRMRGI